MSRLWQVAACAVVISGCGYALVGKTNTLPKEIKRIGVPAFRNLSNTPDLDRTFTDAVRAELQARRYVVVPDETGVDAVLTGSIRSVTKDPIVFTSSAQATKYLITVIGSAEFKLTKSDEIWFSSTSLRAADEYNQPTAGALTDLVTLFTQDPNALERLAKTFAKELVTQILSKL